MEFHQDKMRNVDSPRMPTAADQTTDDIPSSISDKARSDVAQAAETAKAEARRIASQQKEAGADRLGEMAGAVHGAARSLESGMPQMASYVRDAAGKLEDAAKTLRTRNIDDLMGEVGRFARAQPALFFGGAMLAGFALTRFLKSTAPNGSSAGSAPAGTRNASTGWRQTESGTQTESEGH
jgi:uncharacterized phage infection (PIP) family protein YhgE